MVHLTWMSGRQSAGAGLISAVLRIQASPIVPDRGVLRTAWARIAQTPPADAARRRGRGRHGLLSAYRLMNGSLNSDQEWAATASMVFICRQDRSWAGVSIRPDGDCALPSAPRSAGGQSLRTSTFASPPPQPHNRARPSTVHRRSRRLREDCTGAQMLAPGFGARRRPAGCAFTAR